MLKRLISAVFVLGLVLALNGTAVSDVSRGALNEVVKIDPANPRFNSVSDARPEQPLFKKPESAIQPLTSGWSLPAPPQTYFCDIQDYTNGTPAYFWTNPDAYGDDLFNMRFTADVNFDCTLKVAHLLMYALPQTGTPDMRVYLWDDDGFGFPGSKLDSVDILAPGAGLAGMNVLYYVSADFSAGNHVFSDGDEYHYGWTILPSGAGDTLAIISDNATGPYAGEERASEYYGGAWGTMLNDWGLDVSFFILSERCCAEIPYSDCDYQSYWQNIAYFWRAPHLTYGDSAYSMRYDAGPGFDTVQFVDLFVYNGGDFGNDTVYLTFYYDDGGGLPGAQFDQIALDPGTYNAFPTWTTAIPSSPIIVDQTFHIAFSSSGAWVGPGVGTYESCLSSDGTDGVGRSASYWAGGPWIDMVTGWGLDANFIIDPYICQDEFTVCQNNFCYTTLDYFWRLPDQYGDYAQAQQFVASGQECRVQEVTWYLYGGANPNLYTTQSEVSVYTDAGGLPGTQLAAILIGPATGNPYAIFPAPMTVDFTPLNVLVSGPYWIAIESFAPDSGFGIRTLSDAGGGGCDDAWAENYGSWGLMADDWGLPTRDWASWSESEHCCIPFSGRVCAPGEDWAVYQHDEARTGASNNAIGDAWCDLTLKWNYEDPATGITFCGPIIADDGVVCSFTDHFIKFDLTTGAIDYTIPFAPPIIGTGIRCTPSVASIAGYPDPVMFVSGADQQSVAAYNYNTGALIWARTIVTVGPGGLYGNTRWGRFSVVNEGGVDYVYWGTDGNRVVGADALTGVLKAGFPVNTIISPGMSGSTDGTDLYYTTFATGITGDVFSIDASTGAINWQLSGTGMLQGATIFGANFDGPEQFQSGASYDAMNGSLYTNSTIVGANRGFPCDGVFYSINAANGALNFAIAANTTRYNHPVIDVNHIYMPSLALWSPRPTGGDLYAVNKSTGLIEKTVLSPGGLPFNSRIYTDAVLTCEPEPEADIIVVGNIDGFISYYNSVTFEEIFHRRISRGPSSSVNNYTFGSALAPDPISGDPYVAHTNFWGDLMVLTKSATDRPRLEIQSYNLQAPVEFGPALSLDVTIPAVFVNTGCADLTFTSVTADENEFVPHVPDFSAATVSNEMMMRASSIADDLTHQTMKAVRQAQNLSDEFITRDENAFARERMNNAATAFPPYLNGIDTPFVGLALPAGDTLNLVVDVIQNGFTRGPHIFYLELGTDDPDFFLEDTLKKPQVQVNLVGGCLIDTTTLHFGVGAANSRLVTNSGRNGTGDWTPHAYEIDGDNDDYYQGAYVYAVSTYRIATNSQDWTSGGGEVDAFYSMQGDPNWCDNDCKPFLDAGVSLGEITNDNGATYDPISGNMVCKSYIDSVQNYDLGGGWDWENFGAPFDNDSTMGLYVNTRTVGAVDVPELANLTLEIMEFEERNGGNVDDWFLGEYWDQDVVTNGGGFDSVACDPSISTVWSYTVDGPLDNAIGQIKIPFGCGYEPLINCWAEAGASGTPGHGFWGWGIFWDSVYNFMDSPPGSYSDGDVSTFADGEGMATYASKDFGPNDTLSLGIAHFALYNIAGNADQSAAYEDIAHLANKWAGFGRGDVNNDKVVNLSDLIYLANYVYGGGNGPVPFKHLGDVDASGGDPDAADVDYLFNYYFGCGPCPIGDWIF